MNKWFCLLIAVLALSACDSVNNQEVPNFTVRIDLSGYGIWNTYGVSGVGDWKYFNRATRQPSNFPYTASTYTGYGGVLLIMGLDSSTGNYEPLAYDAACPVENTMSVAVGIDQSNYEAVCPQCNSRFNVLTGMGGPISGIAATNKYGLRIYKVHAQPSGGYAITSY